TAFVRIGLAHHWQAAEFARFQPVEFQSWIIVQQVAWRANMAHEKLADAIGTRRQQLADFGRSKGYGRISTNDRPSKVLASRRQARRHIDRNHEAPARSTEAHALLSPPGVCILNDRGESKACASVDRAGASW